MSYKKIALNKIVIGILSSILYKMKKFRVNLRVFRRDAMRSSFRLCLSVDPITELKYVDPESAVKVGTCVYRGLLTPSLFKKFTMDEEVDKVKPFILLIIERSSYTIIQKYGINTNLAFKLN